MTAVQHRDHAHRAHPGFALAVGWAAAVAVAVGVVSGALIALAAIPDLQALAVGSGYGLIPGVLAAVGVVVARRELAHDVPYWRAVSIVVLAVACATGLLFALTQMAIELAPVGVLLGAWTSLVATCIGLLRSRR
ncbi:hypothetical protein [Agrococcus jenensis]|uniref:Uncharacterized protein n=1 Tax=Agrococcus jenensis TaxID=46353 RepID=A0A3N2ATS3_9MICO|nr:hypothetical protein [Agrococcus jenensis]ROR66396.1 hypothetical protein EDD26_1778 [Agrococcus jenensis]